MISFKLACDSCVDPLLLTLVWFALRVRIIRPHTCAHLLHFEILLLLIKAEAPLDFFVRMLWDCMGKRKTTHGPRPIFLSVYMKWKNFGTKSVTSVLSYALLFFSTPWTFPANPWIDNADPLDEQLRAVLTPKRSLFNPWTNHIVTPPNMYRIFLE